MVLPSWRHQFDNSPDPYSARNALGVSPLVVTTDSNGNAQVGDNYIALSETGDPAAPSANGARLYVRDNGAGKTQLVVRFPTGAIQVIATEP